MTTATKIVAISFVLSTEFAASRLAWHTSGEITEALVAFVTLAAAVVFVPISIWRPRWGFPGLLLVWVLVVPIIAYQGIQLLRAELETGRVVAWVYAHQHAKGGPPTSLGGYTFRDAGIRSGLFSYDVWPSGSFSVGYGPPGNEDVAHWYHSDSGWGYYPD